jgi:uncharacterized RDD family membrane protein YckC
MSAQPVDVNAATSVVGRRVAALLVDGLILGAVYWPLFFALAEKVPAPADAPVYLSLGSTAYVITGATGNLFVAATLIAGIAYWIVLPANRGFTLGKALLGIRIVRADGAIAGFVANLIRQILWCIDGIPFLIPCLVGFITANSKPEHRRIGDRAAGTYVVSKGVVGSPLAVTAAAPATAGPPAGWYDDPHGQARLRYWDGAEWTGHTAA